MAERIHEVLPGVLHWPARYPTARLESGSHYLVDERILVDPIAPPEGLDSFDGREIGEILLTNATTGAGRSSSRSAWARRSAFPRLAAEVDFDHLLLPGHRSSATAVSGSGPSPRPLNAPSGQTTTATTGATRGSRSQIRGRSAQIVGISPMPPAGPYS